MGHITAINFFYLIIDFLVTINPPHIVEAESKSVKLVCLAINFYLPTYSWVKNGKTVSDISGLSLHIDNNVIFMAFAKKESSGNYTCIARDNWGTAAAFTYIEIYEGNYQIRNAS